MPNLVGIGKEQVPTNAMLGGLAYQDSVGEIDIDKIKAKTSDTAVDIFVYDTRKDSDGGAWRHRTQNTSWYNEDANTDRGTRKEFPAVAVIVAENDILTIYDGDDPNLPMWMIFRAGGNNGHRMIGRVTENTTSVSMLNGLMCVGRSIFGLHMINFIADQARFKENGYDTLYTLPIGTNRNDGNNWVGANVDGNDLVDDQVNDLAMTVLPNAPIDDATGLPTPTIAVGTQAGMCVIKDNGKVYDYTSFSPVTLVAIEKDVVVGAVDTSGYDYIFKTNLLRMDEAYNTQILSGTGNFYMNSNSGTTPLLRDLNIYAMTLNPSDSTVYRGGSYGFDIITKPITVSSTSSISLISYVDTDYNSGYMVGDIKGAYLADTNTDNLTSTNLVSNGTFDSGISGWTAVGAASITHDSGRLKITSSSGNSNAYTTVTCEVGKKYYFQADFTGHISFHISTQGDAGNDRGYIPYNNYSSSTTRHLFFTATHTTMYVVPYAIGTNNVGYVDNVIVKLADHDRSINGARYQTFSGTSGLSSGLEVHGTVSRAPVATGAELVAYSGWSSSNYLTQPYNSALDFGTGDWSFNFWINPNDSSSGSVIMSRWSYNVDSSLAGRIGIYFNSGNVRFDLTDDGASSYQGITGTNGIQDRTGWHMVNILRRGPNAEMWVDGKLDTNTALTSTSNGSYSNSKAILEIGHSPNMGSPDAGIELALIRISASAPSEEQIKKMYNDEKHLFNENAKCTLSGTTSAVKALAYDDSNDVLHVGTSSGRSEFRGLNRINNTTTAVTTAISASNGLVAEQ